MSRRVTDAEIYEHLWSRYHASVATQLWHLINNQHLKFHSGREFIGWVRRQVGMEHGWFV